MYLLRGILAIAAIGLFLFWYQNLKNGAPDPRAQCAERPTPAEQASCRSHVDFAMSAGW